MAKITYTGTGTGYNFESTQTIQLTHDTFPSDPITISSVKAKLYFKPSRYGYNVSFTATAGGVSSTVTHFVAADDIDGFYLEFTFSVSQSFPWSTLSSIKVACNSSSEIKGYVYSRAVNQYVYVNYALAYTKTKAPTVIAVLETNVAPATEVTLYASGAEPGTSNPITGYEIYRATSIYDTFTLLMTSYIPWQSGTFSTTVESPNGNFSYYYKIKTLGTVPGYDSGLSSKYAKLTSLFTDPLAPVNFNVPQSIIPGSNVTVRWNASDDGINNPVDGYILERKIGSGRWTPVTDVTIQGTSYTLQTTVSNAGQTWKFRVMALALYSNSPYSYTATTSILYPPNQPVIESGHDGYSHNPRPIVLVTVSDGGSAENLTVSAEGYTASRSKKLSSYARVRLRRKNPMTESSETITVINTDSAGNAASALGLAIVGATVFTDPVLVKNETPVKAVHINELRAMLDDIAMYYGLEPHDWNEYVEAGTTLLANWAAHVLEIQEEIRRIAQYVNEWDSNTVTHSITLPVFETPTTPKASVIEQLRYCITLL